MQLDALTATGDARSVGEAEQLLEAHRENRHLVAVVEADARAGGHFQRTRRQLVEALRQRPGQQAMEDAGK